MRNKRGRPLGALNGQRVSKWEPKSWKPIHDLVVILASQGIKQIDIAKRANLTSIQVGQIIRSDLGQKKLLELLSMQRIAFQETRQNKIEKIIDASLYNLETVLTDKNRLNSTPIAMAEKSISALKAFGIAKSDDNSNTKNQTTVNALILNRPEVADRISSGINKVMTVLALNEKS